MPNKVNGEYPLPAETKPGMFDLDDDEKGKLARRKERFKDENKDRSESKAFKSDPEDKRSKRKERFKDFLSEDD